jgi:hypothetical protein
MKRPAIYFCLAFCLLFGAVIGKALGSLDSGMGVIEVLVTLQ